MAELDLNFVKSGSVNDETATVQQILLDSGYAIKVTGTCDGITDTAIKDFQKGHSLSPDGWVGNLTWQRLLELPTGVLNFIKLITKKASFR